MEGEFLWDAQFMKNVLFLLMWKKCDVLSFWNQGTGKILRDVNQADNTSTIWFIGSEWESQNFLKPLAALSVYMNYMWTIYEQ